MSIVDSTPPARTRRYVPAVGPRLRTLLYVILALVALLGANSLYLAAITAMSAVRGESYENWFYQYMFLGHLALGLVLIGPLLVFSAIHMTNTRLRKNRRAIRAGYALFAASIVVLVTGLLLMRLGGFNLRGTAARGTVYWMHIVSPCAAVWLYWLHRLAGPRIKWRLGLAYFGVVGTSVVAMALLHAHDPRRWNVVGPKEGEMYFAPSLARTATAKFIPAETLMMNEYCLKCHQDAHARWRESAHRFSSFNNPAYLASVRETREVALKRDGSVKASRWCAGCHDPVPFFGGAFDDPNYDVVNDPTAHAGITCTVCHAITHVNSTRGNADFTIEEPIHYPFAYSKNAVLQWINNQMIKAKPAFHKQTFLKDFHRSADFCSTCHKVHLPFAINHYKEFLRGQNHYDPYLLSGVSGHGARSFYYPEQAKENCAACHMPLKASQDFGAKLFGTDTLCIHDHMFAAANTALPWLRRNDAAVVEHQKFMDGTMRVDIFGLKEGGTIDGRLHAPLRPQRPRLKPGATYLVETVVRTLKLGHPFTQGTVDSNEVWLDVTATSGGKVIGRSGGIDADREVDPWSHLLNVFLLDREGNRIDRRNPQDIFVALYDNQIPPGATATVHYSLKLPPALSAPVTVEVKLQYRKFDKRYMDFVTSHAKPEDKPIRGYQPGRPYRNELPVSTLAVDRVTLPVEGVAEPAEDKPSEIPAWQRWNDYGIGLFLKGKAELRQAADAFSQVERLNRYDGPLNLARVLHREGRLDEAVAAINRAAAFKEPSAPPWTLAWVSGQINREQGRLEQAESNLRSILEDRTREMVERGFDFGIDIEVLNLLGQTLFDRARQIRGPEERVARTRLLNQAVERFQKTLAVDSENATPITICNCCTDNWAIERMRLCIARGTPFSSPTTTRATARLRARVKSIRRPTKRPSLW